MAVQIYQLKIELKYITPKIWRRILVYDDVMLSDFHKIIQSSMGWENAHLHKFVKNNRTYIMPDEEFNTGSRCIDYRVVTLNDLLKKENDLLEYEYDFGDSWKHDIILEKILPHDKMKYYPVCIDGERNCPPEDCGGFPGYKHLLSVISDPSNEEYEFMKEWVGEEYDPEYFDPELICEILEEEDFGCIVF